MQIVPQIIHSEAYDHRISGSQEDKLYLGDPQERFYLSQIFHQLLEFSHLLGRNSNDHVCSPMPMLDRGKISTFFMKMLVIIGDDSFLLHHSSSTHNTAITPLPSNSLF